MLNQLPKRIISALSLLQSVLALFGVSFLGDWKINQKTYNSNICKMEKASKKPPHLPSALLICIPRVRRREGGQEQGGKEAAMMQVERKERNY